MKLSHSSTVDPEPSDLFSEILGMNNFFVYSLFNCPDYYDNLILSMYKSKVSGLLPCKLFTHYTLSGPWEGFWCNLGVINWTCCSVSRKASLYIILCSMLCKLCVYVYNYSIYVQGILLYWLAQATVVKLNSFPSS